MSLQPSTHTTIGATIADITITPGTDESPRAIGEALRPFLIELRRCRMTGEPMRREILERFCAPASGAAR